MSDHEPAIRMRSMCMFQVMCRCGWVSHWNKNEDVSRAEHELHIELESLTADDFADADA
jgi:hypothetical protein